MGVPDLMRHDIGGDDAHQTYAAEQWTETFADRVAYRQVLLAVCIPA